MTPLVLSVFAAVYLGMALGRWPGLLLDRTGIALIGAIVLVLGDAVTGEEVRAAIDVPTLVILLLQVLPSPGPDLLHFLAVVSTLAGNLLIVGSLANIITVERAKEVGVGLGFFEHAKCGVPIAVLSLAAALAWLAFAAPSSG